MSADLEQATRVSARDANLLFRISDPKICSIFILAMMIAGDCSAATPKSEADNRLHSISDRIATIRDALAREKAVLTEEKAQEFAQWYNWGNGWNNWRNY